MRFIARLALGSVAVAFSPFFAYGQVQTEADGNNSPVDVGTGTLPTAGHFERVGRAPHSLRRVCDLTVFHDALYASHANTPLGSDGATITRYMPGGPGSPFAIAFDWNRPGEPLAGGAAGQGFLRVHAFDGRLWVPDTDPPYNGFNITEPGTEGYVFVSDHAGSFAPPRRVRCTSPRPISPGGPTQPTTPIHGRPACGD